MSLLLLFNQPADGAVALDGTATLTLAATGTLLSTTALSGAATLTLTASGAVVSTGALSGAASLILAATGNLAATSALDGAASLALTATGDLVAASGLSGEATLALAATGALASASALSGEATLSLDATGDLLTDAAVAAVVDDSGHRSGGAGHKEQRRERRFRGQYAGYYTDREFTEWLLAFIAAEEPQLAAEDDLRPPRPLPPPLHTEKPILIEPEPFSLPPATFGLAELELDILELLVAQAMAQRQAQIMAEAINAMALKRQWEEEAIIMLLLA